MSHFRSTVTGVGWMGALRAATRVIAFIKIGLLARLLTPDQFGTVGVASLVLAFLEITTETGVNVFLIQGEGEIKKYLDTAWIVSIVRGFIITALLLIFASSISNFFQNRDVLAMIYIIAAVPFIRGFINPSIVKFQKNLEFSKEFILRFTIFIVDGVFAIALGLLTKSASSLVYGMIAGAIVEVALSFAFIKPRPKLNFDLGKVKKVISRGKWITMSRLFDYVFREGDDIVVGRLLSAGSLGLYQVAYKISSLPITEVGDVVARVTFPVFSKINNRDTLKKAYYKTAIVSFLVMLPMAMVFYTYPTEIILILLGSQWVAAAPVLKVLAAFGLIKGIMSPTASLFMALRKQEYVSFISFVSMLTLIALIYPAVLNYGILGAGYVALIASAVSLPVGFAFLWKELNKK